MNSTGTPMIIILASAITIGILLKINSDYRTEKMREFDNKQAILITGGTTGLGLELAQLFAKNDGNELVLLCYAQDCLRKIDIRKKFKQMKVSQYEYDFNKIEGLESKIEEIYAKHPNIGILVNNAGMAELGHFSQRSDIEVLRKTMRVNFEAPVILTKKFLEKIKKGQVVFISSVVAFSSGLKALEYITSKHALSGFFKAFTSEMKSLKTGIKTTIAYPYLFSSKMFKDASPPSSFFNLLGPERIETVAKRVYEGIKVGDEEIFIPFFYRFLASIYVMVPNWIADFINLPIYEEYFKNVN